MSRTIKQSIYDLLNIYQPYPKLITEHKDAIDQALKEIETILLESLSEDNLQNIGDYEEWGTYAEGFEACREDVEANLLKILGGESE